ncbi:MAG: glycosyltransferase [Terracidiphilus sp.]|jgi:glycosyltransferase involved in cell wall biosynthesis
MKVLYDHSHPFFLAHGGLQTEIEQTKAALEKLGVEVEFLRWWDERQRGDLIYFFGVASNAYLLQAREKKRPVVMTPLFSGTCNRSDVRLKCQGLLVRMILALPFGEGVKQQLVWRTFNNCTHNIVRLEAERQVLQIVYRVPPSRISVIPSGLTDAYLRAGPGPRNESHLICTGTITPRKNFVALAELAHRAQVPILFTGKPYSPDDPYWLRFQKLIDGRWVKHQLVPYDTPSGGVQEMIKLLQAARGFVFMSDSENWCLSAHEAAACGLPLLLQDQKWSRERFGHQVCYFNGIGVSARNVELLKQFYADAPTLSPPAVHLPGWDETASKLKKVFEQVLSAA